MKLLLYCTKGKPYLVKNESDEYWYSMKQFELDTFKNLKTLNGKIVAECDFEVEEIKLKTNSYEAWFETKTLNEEQLREKSCLRVDELYNYLEPNVNGYAINIKNLHIFEKPRELNEYHNNNSSPIEKAPQNTMYARQTVPFKKEFLVKGILQEVRGYKVNEYILISIQPQWLCLILNRIKDVELRRVVLKEMLHC